MRRFLQTAAALALLAWAGSSPAQDSCASPETPIGTDRPTGPNASGTVPQGSLQVETGAGATRGGQGPVQYDLPEARLRFGIADCTEFRIDLPDRVWAGGRDGANGGSDIVPAFKHQFTGLPENLTLLAGAGIALPTGNAAISGRGPAPFVEIPWVYDLGGGLTANGMYNLTFHPRAADTEPVHQTSVYLDQTVSDSADVFVEYADVYQHGAPTQNMVDAGASYRYDPLHQVDFKIGKGVNRAAPDWYFTIGWSLRFDSLFRRPD